MFKFRLYVAGETQNSSQAVSNLNALCLTYLPDRHEIELVDVLRNPKRALKDQIFMTPTLVKFSPLPAGKIIGTLNQTKPVLQALGIGTSGPRETEKESLGLHRLESGNERADRDVAANRAAARRTDGRASGYGGGP